MTVGSVLSVNVGVPRPNPAKKLAMTGIDKQPVAQPVLVSAPGRAKGRSGVAGDPIGDTAHHGGDDQAVYAYAREDYDWWETELSRPLEAGAFGENLTTAGVQVNDAVIGEVWRVGGGLELATTFGRIPCATFQAKMGEPHWTKRFALVNRTGAYLRVVTPGEVRAGDPIEIIHRPARGVSIADAFRIVMHEPSELERLLEAEGLTDDLRGWLEEQLTKRSR